MNNINVFQACSNCGACYNACPVDAISVKEDELFYRPVVDETKCLDCGLCQKVCPVNAPQQRQHTLRAYAAIHNDEQVVQNSSSGGVFRALADQVLAVGGVVYGAAYTEDCKTVKICSTEECRLEQLQKSKYVESRVDCSFREVKDRLERGKAVLYCGAPCQIAGLLRFLGRDYENLITCDFSCGGMPSHKLYQEWLEHITCKLKDLVVSVDFRPKTFGWFPHAIKVQASNGKRYDRLATEDPYFNCFVGRHITVRDYCLACEFADNHYADIVLADFWKYKSVSKVNNKNRGISLLIANSEKGKRTIEALSKQVALTILELEQASYNLKSKQTSAEFLEKRKTFLQACETRGFINTAGKLPYDYKTRLKYKVKKILGRV